MFFADILTMPNGSIVLFLFFAIINSYWSSQAETNCSGRSNWPEVNDILRINENVISTDTRSSGSPRLTQITSRDRQTGCSSNNTGYDCRRRIQVQLISRPEMETNIPLNNEFYVQRRDRNGKIYISPVRSSAYRGLGYITLTCLSFEVSPTGGESSHNSQPCTNLDLATLFTNQTELECRRQTSSSSPSNTRPENNSTAQ